MNISEREQRGGDWDWFAIDDDGHVAHFATNLGKLLPAAVAASKDEWLSLVEFFFGLPRSAGNAEVAFDRIARYIGEPTDAYVDEPRALAERGLYAYDPPDAKGKGAPTPYVLIATPRKSAHYTDYPANIRSLLLRVRIGGCFATLELIPDEYSTVDP